ncbi:hypothetical protein DQG23_28530 [Paenibacillus contaminans]|uniref:Uncharacterized protein n=1 Tax=Paenibacillus contaminans TaxID=450362 RepID=A0A329M8Z2_9BACL|nr:hypothetical protein DQG23_28530 [Paenibacillus contaminans]
MPLPPPAKPIRFANQESVIGTYTAINEMNAVLDISLKNNELYLTVPKMHGVPYKFKLVPVSHDSTRTTFITKMINEQLVFRFSASGEMERVEYTDYFRNNHILQRISTSSSLKLGIDNLVTKTNTDIATVMHEPCD